MSSTDGDDPLTRLANRSSVVFDCVLDGVWFYESW